MAAGLAFGNTTFYLFNNAVYWSYGLKQWSIAYSVPNFEDKNALNKTREKYNCLKAIGWVANSSFALLLGVFRYIIAV